MFSSLIRAAFKLFIETYFLDKFQPVVPEKHFVARGLEFQFQVQQIEVQFGVSPSVINILPFKFNV